jgi:hypothetical protein
MEFQGLNKKKKSTVGLPKVLLVQEKISIHQKTISNN